MGRKKAKGSTSEPLNNGSIVHIESVVRKLTTLTSKVVEMCESSNDCRSSPTSHWRSCCQNWV